MSAKVIIVSVFLVLAIALVFLFFRVHFFRYNEGAYPTKPDGYSVLDNKNKQWRMETLQPKVIGYKTQAGKNFLKIVYKDEEGWKTGKVFVSGSAGENALNRISYVAGEDISLVDFTQLKKLVKIGQRVQIRYLASYPTYWKEESGDLCSQFHPICLYPYLDEDEPIAFKAITIVKELEGNE